jgi:hypothetical protein
MKAGGATYARDGRLGRAARERDGGSGNRQVRVRQDVRGKKGTSMGKLGAVGERNGRCKKDVKERDGRFLPPGRGGKREPDAPMTMPSEVAFAGHLFCFAWVGAWAVQC